MKIITALKTHSNRWRSILHKISSAAAGKKLRHGDALRQQGNLAGAVAAYHQAIWWNTNCFAAYYNLADTLTQQQCWEDAADAYCLAAELNPNFHHAFVGWIESLVKCNRWDETMEACLLTLERVSADSAAITAYIRLGDAYYKKSLFDRASNAYSEAVKLNPKAWHFQHKLGFSLLKQNRWDDAIPAFRRVLELKPDFCWSFDGLGDASSHLGQWEEAEAAYRRATELNPTFPWHPFKLGEVLIRQGKLAEAADTFQNCHKIKPDLTGLKERREEVDQLQRQWERLKEYCHNHGESQRHEGTSTCHDQRLRILLITAYPPYPPTGGAIRLFEEIKFFGSRHQLVVASFYFSESYQEIQTALAPYCELIYLLKLGEPATGRDSNLPEKVHQWSTKTMWRALQHLSGLNFDTVLFDFVFVSQYRELFKNSFTVLEEHNIESDILQQMLDTQQNSSDSNKSDTNNSRTDLETEARLLREYEDSVWPKFSLRTTVSEDDRQKLTSRCRAGETLIVNNGVNTGGMAPVEYSQNGKILFMGHMGYYPNVDAMSFFVAEILPILWQNDPTINLCIAGRHPTPSVREMDTNPRIEVIANPEDMRDVANHCCMTVVPLRMGGGTRLKILDSFSMALPVISTQVGCEGLSVTDGKHLLIRDDPEAFANAILHLRSDSELGDRLRINGRRLVKEQYGWPGIFAVYERELISRTGRP